MITVSVQYTLHTVDCAHAVEADAPIMQRADAPAEASPHRCIINLDPQPDQVRVMTHEEEG